MKYTSTPEKSSVGSLSNRTNPMENRASGPKGTECSVKANEKFKQTNDIGLCGCLEKTDVIIEENSQP